MNGWRVVDCASLEGTIRYVRGHLRITKGEQTTDIPLQQIAVLMVGQHVSLSGAVMAKLSEYGIAWFVVDWRGVPVAGSYPWTGHTRICARHHAQLAMTKPRQKRAWAECVKAKIRGQATVLRLIDPVAARHVRELADQVRSGDVTNCEAQAARLYWLQILGALGESKRSPHQHESGPNGCFDYAYTVLRGYGIRAVVGAGLCGTVGIFHHNRGNMFSLVDDLIEPFRPAIDEALIRGVTLWDPSASETKAALVAAASGVFACNGDTIPTVLSAFAQHFGRYAEGEVETLTVPVWKGNSNAEAG